jgi:glucan phosphoethanolaminetransferase (alkaline phosphatase superfamily)
MAKIDEVKEFIGYLKVLIGIAIAVAISLIVWIFNHYDSLSLLDKIISFVAFLFDLILVVLLNRKIIKQIKSLGDL